MKIKNDSLRPRRIQFYPFLLVAALVAANLSACAPKPDSSLEYYSDANSRFHINWIGQPTLNSYNADATWPLDPQVDQYEIRRQRGKETAHLAAEGNHVVLGPMSAGEHLELELWSRKNGQWTLIKTLVEDVPFDVVVDGVKTWAGLSIGVPTPPHRLFLNAGSVLLTDGQNFDLAIAEIHSNGGKIASFPENQKAEMDQNGRSAGRFHLEIGTLTGTLTLEMRGEDGGNGHDGIAGRKGEQGRPGLPLGGDFAPCGLPNGEPARSGPGARGSSGENGAAGKKGGSAGEVSVVIQTVSLGSTLNILSHAGRGGSGGAGGPAGPGGDPGISLGCPIGSAGQPGYPGEAGEPGQSGAVGPVYSNVAVTRLP